MPVSRLVEFMTVLRGAGVPVSTAETLDALAVAEQLGLEDRARLKAGLSLALAKTGEDKARFSECFDRFFHFSRSTVAPVPGEEDESLNPPPSPGGEAAGEGGGSGGQQPASALGRMLVADEPEELERRMARAMDDAGLRGIRVITQKGLYARRIMQGLGVEDLDGEILSLERDARPASVRRARMLREARDALRARVIEEVNRQFLLHARSYGQELREQAMRNVSLRHLHEFDDVRAQVERMARRLRILHSRRTRSARRGPPDLRRTIGESIRYGGVPLALRHRRRRRGKSRVYVVCDVSRSVAPAARFLLLFLQALHEVLPDVRIFAFASRFGEVTDYFRGEDPDRAVARIMTNFGGSGTDYGAMLEDFSALCGGELDRRGTLIVLGDARNNELPARQELLREMAARLRQVYWLNPEATNRWGSGDSVMPLYLPACRRAMSCRNLAQLERFVDELLSATR